MMRSKRRICLAHLLVLVLMQGKDNNSNAFCSVCVHPRVRCHGTKGGPANTNHRPTATAWPWTTSGRSTLALAYWTPVNILTTDDEVLRNVSRKAISKTPLVAPLLASLALRLQRILRSKYTTWIIISVVALRLALAISFFFNRRGTAKINIEMERQTRYQELLLATSPSARIAAAAAVDTLADKQPFDWRTTGAMPSNPREKTLSPPYKNPAIQRQQQMPFLNIGTGASAASTTYNLYDSNGADSSTSASSSTAKQPQQQQHYNRQSPYYQPQQPQTINPNANRHTPYPVQSSETWNGNLQQLHSQPNSYLPQFPNQVNGHIADPNTNGATKPYDYQIQNPNSIMNQLPNGSYMTNPSQAHQSPPLSPHQQPHGHGQAHVSFDSTVQPLSQPQPQVQQQMKSQPQNHVASPQVQTFDPTSSALPLVTPHGTIHPPPDAATTQLETTASRSTTTPAPSQPTKPQPKRIDKAKEEQRLAQEAHWQQIILDGRHDILHPSLRRLFSSPDAIPVIQTLLHHLELVAATSSSIEHLRNNVVGRRRAWMLLRHVQHRSYCVVYDANEDRAIVAIGDLSSQFQTENAKDQALQRDLLTNIVAYKNTLFHRGIVEDALELRRDILDCLKTTTSPNLPVIFVGHGRGGAMAAVLGLLQHQERQRPVEVVAFDPPPVWNAQESTLSYMTSIVCEQDFMPSGVSSTPNTLSSSSTNGTPNTTLVVPGRVIVLYEREDKVDKRIAPPPVHRAAGLEEVYQLFGEFQSKHPGAVVGAVFHPDGSSLGSSVPFRMDPDHEIAVQHDKLKRLVKNLKAMNENPKQQA